MNQEIVSMILLAVLQGITEFLPVSSSGHLVIGAALLGVGGSGDDVLFETAVHAGTLGAVLVYYRGRISRIASSLSAWAGAGFRAAEETREDLVYIGLILLGSVPAAAAGILLRGPITSAFGSPVLVSLFLVATGLFLMLTRGRNGERKVIGWKIALLIGLAQAVAILPGFSRSGLTITAAILCGIGFRKAAEFSFMLSIPAVAGALLLEWLSAGQTLSWGETAAMLAAAAVAFGSGYVALRLLVWILSRERLYRFSWYLIPAGAAALLWFAVIG